MRYSEMISHLKTDFPKVQYWAKKLLPKVVKEFCKEYKSPLCKVVLYNMPESRNEFIISYYAENNYEKMRPTVMSGAIFWIDDKKRYVLTYQMSKYRHKPEHEYVDTPLLYVFTSHFIKRYNERFLKDASLSANDIIGRFLCRNKWFTPIEINEEINRNIENYDPNTSIGYKVRDGLCFTCYGFEGELSDDKNTSNDRVDTICFVFTTFISAEELKSGQIEAIDLEDAKAWERYFKTI